MIIILIPLAILILFFAYNRMFRNNWKNGLECEVAFEREYVSEGESCLLREVLTNRKRLPLLFLQLKFDTDRGLLAPDYPNAAVSDRMYVSDVFSLRPFERVTRHIEFVCKKRGYYRITDADLIVTNLFEGKKDYTEVLQNANLYVYPALLNTEVLTIPFEHLVGQEQRRSFLFEDPFTFRGVRDYVSTDPMKNLNWKLTAKTGSLKVNQRDATVSGHVSIFLNLEDPQGLFDTELLEQGIRLAMTMSVMLAADGIGSAVYTNGRDCITGEVSACRSTKTDEDLRLLARVLARIDLSKERDTFSQLLDHAAVEFNSADSTCCVISSHVKNDTVDSVLGMTAGGGRVIWLCPTKDRAGRSVNLPGVDFYPMAM